MSALLETALALDPVRLAERAGLAPDPWQASMLRTGAQRLLLNCCRQSGKSSCAAVLAMHTALYQPESPVLLLSPSLRQSQELFKKCLDVYRALDRPLSVDAETRLTLELENGSRILSLPGTERSIRGFSGVKLLVVDEAARVPDELYFSVRPMLAVSNGRLVALSTPFGERGWWFEAWRSDEPWERYRVPATECPRISAAFLEEERAAMGQWWYSQEYDVTFMAAQDSVFRLEDIERALDPAALPPLFPDLLGLE